MVGGFLGSVSVEVEELVAGRRGFGVWVMRGEERSVEYEFGCDKDGLWYEGLVFYFVAARLGGQW